MIKELDKEWEQIISDIKPFSCEMEESRGGYVQPNKESGVVKYNVDMLDECFYANTNCDWIKKK